MKCLVIFFSLIAWTYAQQCNKVFHTKLYCLSAAVPSINQVVACPTQNNAGTLIQIQSMEYHVIDTATCPPVTPVTSTCYNLTETGAACSGASCTITGSYRAELTCMPSSTVESHYIYFSYTCIPTRENIDLCQAKTVTTSFAHLLDPTGSGGAALTGPVNCMCELTLPPSSEVVVTTPWFDPNATSCERLVQFHDGAGSQQICAQYDALVLNNCGGTAARKYTIAYRTHTSVETSISITLQGSYVAQFTLQCGMPDTAPIPTQAQIKTTANIVITTSTFAPATLSTTLPVGPVSGGSSTQAPTPTGLVKSYDYPGNSTATSGAESDLGVGAIAGIVVALLVAVGLAVGAILFYFLKVKKDKENKATNKINMKFKSKENPYEYDNTVGSNTKDELADLDYSRYETVKGKPDVNLNKVENANGNVLNNATPAADTDVVIDTDADYEPTFMPLPPKVESSDL